MISLMTRMLWAGWPRILISPLSNLLPPSHACPPFYLYTANRNLIGWQLTFVCVRARSKTVVIFFLENDPFSTDAHSSNHPFGRMAFFPFINYSFISSLLGVEVYSCFAWVFSRYIRQVERQKRKRKQNPLFVLRKKGVYFSAFCKCKDA
jgi:hypothetical protein